jgi:sugar lactone lactonase YvrE
VPQTVGDAPTDIPLPLGTGTVHVNQRIVGDTSITQRAIFVTTTLSGKAVVAEATAIYGSTDAQLNGNPCSTVDPTARPSGLVLRDGSLYISDYGRNVISKLDLASGVERIVAGIPGGRSFSGDGGPATMATLCGPSFMSFDSSGNLYIADTSVNRIRKVDATTGVITTVAGRSTSCGFNTGTFSGDGGPATSADLDTPFAVAFDAAGNMYITDGYNHRIRRVAKTTGIITTIAGSGPYGDCCNGGFAGDGGPATAARLYQPYDLLFDGAGRLVFSDNYNNRMRRISGAGIITTIAGNTSLPVGFCDPFTEGSQATAAVLCGPAGLSLDPTGTLFFTDYYNNRVRKITAGTVTTVAGSGPKWPAAGGYSGDGGPATLAVLNYATGLANDGSGRLYIADTQNHVIRMVDQLGTITTVPENRVG